MTYFFVLLLILFLSMLFKRIRIGTYRKTLIIYVIIISLILIFISACRYELRYSDFTINYNRMIQVRDMNWQEVLSYSTEILHQIYRKLISILFESPQWYFVISAIIFVSLFSYTIYKWTPNVYISLFLFYTMFGYFTSHNITRQSLAVAISLLCIPCIVKGRMWRYLIIILIASLFHTSALFFLPLYWLSYIKINKRVLYAYLGIGIVAVVFQNQLFRITQLLMYSDYVEGSYGTTPSSIVFLIPVFGIVLIQWLLYKRRNQCVDTFSKNSELSIVEEERLNNFINHCSFMYIMSSVLSFTKMLLMSRVAMFYSIGVIMLVTFSINTKNMKGSILRIVVYLFGIAWFIARLVTGKLIPTPYVFFWNV